MRKSNAGMVAAAVAFMAHPISGADVPIGRKANVEFRVIGTARGAGTFPIGSMGSAPLAEGGTTEGNMQVRLSSASEGPSCGGSSVTMGPTFAPNGPAPLWQIEATVRHVEMDKIVIGYEWKRRAESAVGAVPESEGRGEVTLNEAGRVLLDYVPVEEASAGCYRNVGLELSASIAEDPSFRDRRIGYDLWLATDDHGRRLTRRLQLIGKQGESVAFDYGTVRSRLENVPLPPRPAWRPIPTSDVIEMEVRGGIRGRFQPDGSIDLRLSAVRTARPSDGRWATEAHGEKRFRATPGETLRLELPPPGSFGDVNEPETFKAIAEQRVALVLTPTVID